MKNVRSVLMNCSWQTISTCYYFHWNLLQNRTNEMVLHNKKVTRTACCTIRLKITISFTSTMARQTQKSNDIYSLLLRPSRSRSTDSELRSIGVTSKLTE